MATLSEKLTQETEKLNDLMKKREALDRKIKKTQENIEKYKLIQNNEKIMALEQATAGTGVSVEDILSALKNGDLMKLQERMVAAQASHDEGNSENAGETDEIMV